MIAVWLVVVIVGLTLSAIASGRALESAEALGHRVGLSPFIIGLTIVSTGTDLPEIANSISAAAAGRGDLNVGDSTGSAATQITFVLAILILIRPVRTDRRFVATTGLLTVAALLGGAALMRDQHISNTDGALLVLGWLVTTALVGETSRTAGTAQPTLFVRGVGRLVVETLGALAAVGVGAVAAVQAFGQITDSLGVPEYATSFFLLSMGTSLPELMVDGRALSRGQGALALGAILGASLVDSTLSLGIGPMMFATDVSEAAAEGTLIVAGVVFASVLLLLSRREHRWPSALVLMVLYAALFPLLID